MNKRSSIALVLGLVVICLAFPAFFFEQTQTDDQPVVSSLSVEKSGITAEKLMQQQAQLPTNVQGWNSESPLAGKWGRYEQEKLQPNAALRGQFDQLLTQRGDQPISNIRNMVQTLATQDLGPEGGLAVTMLWDRYLTLLVQDEAAQNSVPTHTETPEKWIASRLIFFTQARASLGPEWGNVFFAKEEAQIRELEKIMEQLRSKAEKL